MKICYMANGRSVHARRWLKYFVEKKHEVHLITFSSSVEIDGVIVHTLDKGYVNYLPGLVRGLLRNKTVRNSGWKAVAVEEKTTKKKYFSKLAKWRFLPQIKNMIEEIKPDILHAHSLDVYGFLASMVKFHPLIITPWGSDVFVEPDKSLLARWQVKHAIKKADLITASSEHILNKVGDICRARGGKRLIQFGVDARNDVGEKEKMEVRSRICSQLSIPETANIIICPRGFRQVYNNDVIFEAAVELLKNNPDVYFIFLQYSDNYSHFKTIMKNNRIVDNIKMLGYVKHEEIYDYYRSSDILVSIPSWDSTSVSLWEGMFLGCIPVVSDLPANRECLEDKKNGVLVDIEKDSLLNGILWLFENRGKWDGMKAHNLKIVKEKADYYTNMGKMENIYKSILNGQKHGAQ